MNYSTSSVELRISPIFEETETSLCDCDTSSCECQRHIAFRIEATNNNTMVQYDQIVQVADIVTMYLFLSEDIFGLSMLLECFKNCYGDPTFVFKNDITVSWKVPMGRQSKTIALSAKEKIYEGKDDDVVALMRSNALLLQRVKLLDAKVSMLTRCMYISIESEIKNISRNPAIIDMLVDIGYDFNTPIVQQMVNSNWSGSHTNGLYPRACELYTRKSQQELEQIKMCETRVKSDDFWLWKLQDNGFVFTYANTSSYTGLNVSMIHIMLEEFFNTSIAHGLTYFKLCARRLLRGINLDERYCDTPSLNDELNKRIASLTPCMLNNTRLFVEYIRKLKYNEDVEEKSE
jgi:hypothetical protein